MVSNQSCPDLSNILWIALTQWKQGKDIVRPDKLQGKKSYTLWKDQMSMGWRNVLGGSISKLWGEIQQDHYNLIGSRKYGATWAIGLVEQLWLISWEQ